MSGRPKSRLTTYKDNGKLGWKIDKVYRLHV